MDDSIMATALRSPGATLVVNGQLDEDILLRVPPDAHTLRGFRKWVLSNACPEKLPVMFLGGEIYVDMSKEEIRTHADVKTEVAVSLGILNRAVDFGKLYINGVLLTNEEADVANNPDMLAVFWDSVEQGLVEYVTRGDREVEIVGSPDWALEIVSRSSVTKDKRQLRHAYHRARIREYWIIDARRAEVSFVVLSWRKSGYAAARHRNGWVRSRVFGREFRLTRTHDRRGAWKYTLEYR
jgi:Uma2 family endonuclease